MTEIRDRLSERITGERVKLEARRAGPDVVRLAVGAAIAVIGAVVILAQIAPSLVRSSNEIAFEVDNARAVRPGLNEIRIKGIPAGRITGVDLVDGRPVIRAKVEEEFGPVFRDGRAELRPNSALEDQFIDVVDRGTPAAGEASVDEPLGPSQTTTPVSVDDVLSTFDGDTRTRLRVLLSDLGKGLDGEGSQLAAAFSEVTPLLEAAGRLSEQLGRRGPLTERLVHNVGVLMDELGEEDARLRTLVRDGSATLTTLQASSGDLDATLRQLPPTLTAVNSSFRATRGVLGDVNTAVRTLDPVADDLEGALASVRSLSDDAQPAVAALQQPVRRLVPFTGTLQPLSRDLASAITTLRPQVDTLDVTTKDLVECETGIKGFFQWDASMTKFGDSRGQAPRGNLAIGLQTLGIASPEEEAYQGCTPGAPIGARPPAREDER